MCMINRGNEKKSFQKVEVILLADCQREEVKREISISPYGGVDIHSLVITGISAEFMSTISFEKGTILSIHQSGKEYIGEVL